jgi:WhiB family transcriptional regulator, redox-sensing transcriptional regulator
MMPAVEAYPLPARPLPASPEVGPIVDLRGTAVDTVGLDGLAPWLWSVEYVRRFVAGSGDGGIDDLVEDPIKGFDSSTGTDQPQLARVLDALDDGRAVAFYGWWPTAELAGVSDILGVDAMDVPPPDRKGAGLAEGHAVVALGYGRHAAFPGGGYLIVRNPWAGVGWGDRGDGYLPFTYLRAYAIALRTYRLARDAAGDGRRATPRKPQAERRADEPALVDHSSRLAATLAVDPIDRLISRQARCFDPRSSYTGLFFSQNPLDVVRAKSICAKCTVRDVCLARALERGEPYGVWGGEFLYEGRVVTLKRGRGRPRKLPLPTLVDEITGMPVVA